MGQYTKLHRSIWTDLDFVTLPASAQRTYLLLISQPDISHCGVLALTLGRWATLAADTTRAQLTEDIATLAAARFVVVDDQTEECWIRSYMVYDGLSRVHNGHTAIVNAADRVLSTVIADQIHRLLVPIEEATEGATERATEGATEGATELQQPAASSLKPADNSQQPAADPVAAAIAIYIRHRCDQPGVRNPTGLARTIQRTIHTDHPTLANHHTSTAQTICTTVFGMTELDYYRATITQKD